MGVMGSLRQRNRYCADTGGSRLVLCLVLSVLLLQLPTALTLRVPATVRVLQRRAGHAALWEAHAREQAEAKEALARAAASIVGDNRGSRFHDQRCMC